ncbi:MAG: hypothetical protein Q9180_003582 [Flavoplaca navasiana]
MSEPKALSTNPKSVASRERGKEWSDIEKTLYKKETADRVAIHKRLGKLKGTDVWKDGDAETRAMLEQNAKDNETDHRIGKGLHASCYESELRQKARMEEEEEARLVENVQQEAAGKVDEQAQSSSLVTDGPSGAVVTKYMAPIVTIIQQRIIHFGGYEDLKAAGSSKPLDEFKKFTDEFSSSKNAADVIIESPYGKEDDHNDDIVEVDEQEQIVGRFSSKDDNAELHAEQSPHGSVDLDAEDEDEDMDEDEDEDEDIGDEGDEDMDDEGDEDMDDEAEQEEEGDEETKEVI